MEAVSANDRQPTTNSGQKLGVGPMVAIAVLILLFAAGGVYFFLREKARLQATPLVETINT